MGKLKAQSPICCIKYNWENWLNRKHILDRIYLTHKAEYDLKAIMNPAYGTHQNGTLNVAHSSGIPPFGCGQLKYQGKESVWVWLSVRTYFPSDTHVRCKSYFANYRPREETKQIAAGHNE